MEVAVNMTSLPQTNTFQSLQAFVGSNRLHAEYLPQSKKEYWQQFFSL